MPVETMTGLEFMQAMITGKLPHPPICETVPMLGKSAEMGRVTFETMADSRHINLFEGVHGGFFATVMDTVTGCAIHTMLEAGIAYATVDLNVKMLRPVPINKKLYAQGEIVNLSKSLGVSVGTLKDDADKLYAHANATCMILRP